MRVYGNVLVERALLELGEEVPGHGEEEDGVVEGEGGGATPGDGDAHAHDVAQIRVLGHERVVCGGKGEGKFQFPPYSFYLRRHRSQGVVLVVVVERKFWVPTHLL